MHLRRLFRPLVGLATCAVVVAAVAVAAAGVGAQSANQTSSFSKEDRAALLQRIVAGEKNVTLLITASSSSVADAVRRLGGTVQHRDDRVGYLRVTVPVGSADDVARLNGVAAIDVDRVIQMPNPRPQDVGANADPPGPGTPAQNPYMPTQDIGAPQFVAANPTYDGRGITIGIIDGGVDLLTPELQTAKKDDGQSIPKIRDWVNFNHPVDDGDPTWIDMATQVKGKNGTFIVAGKTYRTPRGQGGSNFRFGTFNENSMTGGASEWARCSASRGDVDRDGTCGETIALLWDGDEKVWVDTNQDLSFSDQKAMEQFSKNRDFGLLGTDNAATAVRESVPFTVQADEKLNRVNLGIVASAHGTHVAGIAAGKNFFGGVLDGVAPEAQIVSVNVCLPQGGCTFNGLIEGMIYAIADAKVDVANMSIGGLAGLNDGNSVFAETYKKLIKDHNVQLFISSGNSGPGFNTIGSPSDTDGVMSVGAYITKASFESNYGAVTELNEQLHPFSSRGPLENGAFKPNVIASGNAISTVPAWQAQQCLAPQVCPPGYGLFNGTSMASPQAAGAAALLLTAAKFGGAEAKPWQLRLAMMSSARFIPTAAAHEQGSGLIDVGAAWNLLKAKNFKEVDIVSRATVNTVLSDLLTPPHQGPGIYEREGWSPGETGTRQLTLTRTNGGQSDTYQLSWTGNDGTFGALPATVNLKNGPVTLNIAISPTASGVHSAILNVNDPTTGGIEHRVLNTIVAAEQLTESTGWTASKNGSAARADRANFVFDVPESDLPQALRTVTDIADGRIRVPRYHPWGVPIDSATTAGFCTGGATCDPITQAVTNPATGVWELATEVSRGSLPAQATFAQTASLISVSIDPASWTEDPAVIGTQYSKAFTFTNNRASFTGGAVGTTLGSAFTARKSVAHLGSEVIQIPVTASATSLNVKIGNTSDINADLDLFVFNPDGGFVAQSADADSEEEVTVVNPVAGTWFALVDGFSVPAGTTDYDYLDSVANPAFGTISITDPPALRAAGSTWSATASVTPLASAGPGRFLRGFVEVREGAGVLARAEVQLKT